MKFTKNTALLISAFAVLIQIVIIGYNAYTGFITVPDAANFFVRLLTGSLLSALFGMLIVFIDLLFINYLDGRLPWDKKIFLRSIVEFLLVVLCGAAAGILLTLLAHLIFPYYEDLSSVIFTNTLITIVVNILLASALEAVIFFKRNQEAKTKAERLEKENALIRIETLKNQLNPHFLFNSLNVLSALIRKDPGKAETFIEEFSSVYRYTLDVIDKQLVTLREELNFANSYFYLQQIRFGRALVLEVDVDASKLGMMLPSLSVQIILENAVKHNRASEDSPLIIKLFVENDCLIITNNLQSKSMNGESKGIGLKNLSNRCSFIAGKLPEFGITQNEYKAKLPLIQYE